VIKSWKIIGYDERGKTIDLTSKVSDETANMIESEIGKNAETNNDLDDYDGESIEEFQEGETAEEVKSSEY
jgi:hypothetical protein